MNGMFTLLLLFFYLGRFLREQAAEDGFWERQRPEKWVARIKPFLSDRSYQALKCPKGTGSKILNYFGCNIRFLEAASFFGDLFCKIDDASVPVWQLFTVLT